MLEHILTHKSDYTKIEDVYNEEGVLLFTIQYTKTPNEKEADFTIDYVRAHKDAPSGPALETYQKLYEQERKKEKEQPSFKELRENDPDWQECKKASKLLLRQGLKTQVKTLIREYNKSHLKI